MYEIYLERSVEKELKKIPSEFFKTITSKIKALSNDPRPHGCKKLKDTKNFWRIRIGSYRVVYEIIESSNRINIYRIKHRKDVYK